MGIAKAGESANRWVRNYLIAVLTLRSQSRQGANILAKSQRINKEEEEMKEDVGTTDDMHV